MISAIVLAKNEEKNLKDCLEGLQWCDEVLVIDDNSKDKTEIVANEGGAKVITHSLEGDFSRQRNFALRQVYTERSRSTQADWVFFVDADERVSPELAQEIQAKIKKTDTNGFYFRRIDNFLGRWLKHGEIGGWSGTRGIGKLGGVRILRLARKEMGEWQRRVDEKWLVEEKTETLVNPLLHYPHPRLADFLESINKRTSLNAQQFYEDSVKMGFLEWLKPLAKFIWNYFFLGGFLDGIAGFVFAVLMSLHSFLVRGKLYLLWKKS